MIRPKTQGAWCMASEWFGVVWLDGRDVTRLCRGVLFEGERPVAVDLYALGDRGEFLVEKDEIVSHVVRGTIMARLRRRVDMVS